MPHGRTQGHRVCEREEDDDDEEEEGGRREELGVWRLGWWP